MNDKKNCSCTSEQHDQNVAVRIMERLERIEEKVDNLAQELEKIGALLLEEDLDED